MYSGASPFSSLYTWMSSCIISFAQQAASVVSSGQVQESGSSYLFRKYKQSEITVDIICNHFISENGKTQIYIYLVIPANT